MSLGQSELMCTVCEGRWACSDGGKPGSRKQKRFEKEMTDFKAYHEKSCGSNVEVAFLGRGMDI